MSAPRGALRRAAGLFNRVRLSRKLILINVFLCVVPVFSFSLALNHQLGERVRAEQNLSFEREIDRYVLTLEAKLDSYTGFAQRLASDQYVCAGLAGIRRGNLRDAYLMGKEISDYVGRQMKNFPSTELRDITYYSDCEAHPVYAARVTTLAAGRTERWYERYRGAAGRGKFLFPLSRDLAGDYFSIVRPVRDTDPGNTGPALGLVRVDLNLHGVFSGAWSFPGDRFSLYVVDAETGAPIYTENPERYALSLFDQARRDGGLLAVRRRLERYGLDATFFIDGGAVFGEVRDTRRLLWAFGLGMTGAALLLSVGFSRLIVRRIHRLVRKMAAVEEGKLEAGEALDGADEIAELDNHFENMLRRLKRQLEENYVQRHLAREAEFNALKFQINPHFLFNTLETINSMAVCYDAQEIGEISQLLGEMLRYSLRVGAQEPAPLRAELSHIKNYVTIQKFRFGERFDVICDVPEPLAGAPVLPFLLQPVVENVLKHCLDASPSPCVIKIRAREKGGCLVLDIADNGPGMAGEMAEALNRAFAAPEGGNILGFAQERGIGLKNVNLRIRLRYGEGYGLSVASEPGAGTRVTLRLPGHRPAEEA